MSLHHIMSLTNLKRTNSGSKPRFRAKRPSTELPSLGAPFKDKSNLNYTGLFISP